MSFEVLIVPEDPTYNGAILKPLIARMLKECGRPRAKVIVLENPRASGYENAKSILLDHVLELYQHVDLVLFLPDADGKNRRGVFATLEEKARLKSVRLICCAAEQEVETWLLAGHKKKLDGSWADIRADRSVKETVFEPFLRKHGDPLKPGAGRELLMQETLRNYNGLLQRCPELRRLQNRIRRMLRS